MRVALFIPCLIDQWFPRVGEATVRVLEHAGCEVDYPEGQTCCGQPAYNAGFVPEARSVAARFLEVFEKAEAIVTPSGSCASMVRRFYPDVFRDSPEAARKAAALGERTFELSEFLVRKLGIERWPAHPACTVTYHDSCHLRRELGVTDEPRRLLGAMEGVTLRELKGADQCCGFGGLFAVKYPELSTEILADKVKNVQGSGAEVLVTSDAGCLAQISGGLRRQGAPARAVHFAEFLAEALPDAG